MLHEDSDGDSIIYIQNKSSLNVLLHWLAGVSDSHWLPGPRLIAITSETQHVVGTLETAQLWWL